MLSFQSLAKCMTASSAIRRKKTLSSCMMKKSSMNL